MEVFSAMVDVVEDRISRRLFSRQARSRLAAPLAAAAILAGFTAAAAGAGAVGWRLNSTPSLDGVFYRVVPIAQAKVGDYVEFCRPLPVGNVPKGPCPDGSARLLKRVIATAGDRVVFMPHEIAVYYRDAAEPAIFKARYFPKDSNGNDMPHPSWGGEIHLYEGDVVVIGDHERSLDSRYWGVVSKDWEYRR